MTTHQSDILLPRATWSAAITRSRLAAFVPISVALIGVAVILFGGVSARIGDTVATSITAVDPVTTGSIQTPEDRRRAIEMLDR